MLRTQGPSYTIHLSDKQILLRCLVTLVQTKEVFVVRDRRNALDISLATRVLVPDGR